jgi:transcription-repair coupling factor (superfamily II helicase)
LLAPPAAGIESRSVRLGSREAEARERFDPVGEALARIRRMLPPTPGGRAIGGVCQGARPLLVAALAEQLGTLTAIVPTTRDGEDLLAGLRIFAGSLGAVTLPAEVAEAYLGRTPPLGATAAAAHALGAIAEGRARVAVVAARLLPYPLPDPQRLRADLPRFRPGDVLDLAETARLLAGLGYRRVELVEEAGEFAVRGEVIDIATPEIFVRLVLDVDAIDGLRTFDPTSQRSGASLEAVDIPSLHLFSHDAEARRRLAGKMAAAGCTLAAEAAREGHSPQYWEGFLGWAQPHLHAWEIFPHAVVCEPDSVLAEVDRVLASLRHAREALAADQVALPEPAAWLATTTRCREALAAADRVEELGVDDGGTWLRLVTQPAPVVATRPQALVEELRRGVAAGTTQALIVASDGEVERFAHLLREVDLTTARGWAAPPTVGLVAGTMPHGFIWPAARLAVLGHADITSVPPPQRRLRSLATVLADMRDLRAGDFVVHAEHGIGRFLGFRSLRLNGGSHECVELEYAGGGKLLVPMERADVLEKYAGAEGAPPHLDRLGGGSWERTKKRVKKALRDMAEELLKVQAQRALAHGFAFAKDSPWQREFEAAFEYELTSDQEQAIREVKRDMESSRPMDRLLVGDVGYGKTEVAMRAAFKAVMDGKQVAVLAPTTILAEQHRRTFARRFAGFPVEIRWLSRFIPRAEQKKVLEGLAAGIVDLVIGTHRLLAADVTPRDLGLLIVDEEQRFGVAQKERLKRLKITVDVLSLSATPIPRTLNQGLVGLRDISVIETPPRDRLAVQTHVLQYRPEVVREAILTEMARGGQTFLVHNRVASMGPIATMVQETVPEASIVVAHGQLPERGLERSMAAFIEGRADVLVATAIIENGLDIPNANTLIVNRADRFGLAQLYQLRGRVGRSDRLAFAYLLVPTNISLTEEARQRLAAILEFAELGAGFRIAARDLEIRGAGNLLGAEQHGHLRAVGFETYSRLLEEAVRELRGEEAPPPATAVEMRLGLDIRLPEHWIGEENLRLVIYRRIAAARDDDELERLRVELADRFGPPPPQLQHLFLHQRLRLRAERLGVTRVRRLVDGWEIEVDPGHPSAHQVAMRFAAAGATLTPAGVLRWRTSERSPAPSVEALIELLSPLMPN